MKTEIIIKGVSGNTCWISFLRHTIEKADGKIRTYFSCMRGEKIVPPEEKLPDAVIAVGFCGEGENTKIVLIDEYRIPIGRREIGMPAGLIDDADYGCYPALLCGKKMGSLTEAVKNAAIREFKQETGMDFYPIEISSPHLFSSAGMTNESVCIVIGKASGVPSKDYLEEEEDINTTLYDRQGVIELLKRTDVAFGKHAWAFLWSIKNFGFPNLSPLQVKN